MAQQVQAAQYVLEEAKEQFNVPIIVPPKITLVLW
jgi:hypothetical protein